MSSLEVCSLSIFWEIYCFSCHSSSLWSMLAIWLLKCSLSSSKNFCLRVLRVAISSSKYFSDFWMTASAFSSSDSLAWRISSKMVSVLSNLSSPSLAELLMRERMSFAPYSILQTEWPLCWSNMRQDGQIMLARAGSTCSIGCSSTRRRGCGGGILRRRWVSRLSVLRPC